MVNYPNPLQQPPAGFTLPERFRTLTQVSGGTGNVGPTTTTGTNGTSLSALATKTAGNSTTPSPISAIDLSRTPSNNNTLLVDPNFASLANSSDPINTPAANPPTNVGQHVLNNQGEVDGSAIGLGKTNQNPSDSHEQGLSPGAKAGAIAGSLVTLLILVAIGIVVRKLHRAKSNKDEQTTTINERDRNSSLTENESDYM